MTNPTPEGNPINLDVTYRDQQMVVQISRREALPVIAAIGAWLLGGCAALKDTHNLLGSQTPSTPNEPATPTPEATTPALSALIERPDLPTAVAEIRSSINPEWKVQLIQAPAGDNDVQILFRFKFNDQTSNGIPNDIGPGYATRIDVIDPNGMVSSPQEFGGLSRWEEPTENLNAVPLTPPIFGAKGVYQVVIRDRNKNWDVEPNQISVNAEEQRIHPDRNLVFFIYCDGHHYSYDWKSTRAAGMEVMLPTG